MIRSLLILLLSGLLFLGCESDIVVFQEDITTPVVYCLLDQDQPIQSLRLSRSYSSYRASEPPDSPDSINLKRALDIALEQVKGGVVEKRVFFKPVDIEKDSGFFPLTEHWIYQTDMEILSDTRYNLIIYLDDSDKIVYSTCTTVAPFEITNPAYPLIRNLHFQTDHNPQFYWTGSVNAGIYQLGFILHYDEISATEMERKKVDLSFNTKFVADESARFINQSINSNQFYIKLNEQLISDPGLLRKFVGIDSYIVCGGTELAYLVKLQTSGQTFSLMEYTNILNGIGVFSSILSRQTNGFILTDQTIDSLAYGHYTYDLNFLDRNGVREEGGGK